MEPEKKSNGAFVGLAIIIIILIIGGIYMWKANKKTAEEQKIIAEQQATAITSQDSAELDALEQDATATDSSVGVDADSVN
jgi:uncharacterized protein YpmB